MLPWGGEKERIGEIVGMISIVFPFNVSFPGLKAEGMVKVYGWSKEIQSADNFFGTSN